MAATATGATAQADAQKVIESEAYADYVAVKVHGQTAKDRADEMGKNPSTVSAAVKRIQGKIDDGTIEDPALGGAAGPGLKRVNRTSLADEMLEGASMFIESYDRVETERKRVHDRIQTMSEQLTELDAKQESIKSIAGKSGFDWDAFDARVADAEGGEEPSDEGDGS